MFYSFKAQAINYQFEVEATGVTRYGIDHHAIGNAFLLIPPLSEQRAIVEFLDRETARIDALIARYQHLIEILDEKRAAIISESVTKGLDKAKKSKKVEIEWIDSIPVDWTVS